MARRSSDSASAAPAVRPQRKPVRGVVGAIFAAIGHTLKNLIFGILNPKRWILLILIVGLSTALNWLLASGKLDAYTDNAAIALAVKVVTFLTYAGGGVSKEVPELLSGTFGKTVCASFLVSLLTGKLKGLGKGLKMTAGSLFGKYARPAKAIAGIGLSFIVFSWCAGNSGMAGTMVGVSGCAMLLKALGGVPGVLRSLSASLSSYKMEGNRRTNLTDMNALLSGAAAGFLLASPITMYVSARSVLILGAALAVLGFVFGLFVRNQRKGELYA